MVLRKLLPPPSKETLLRSSCPSQHAGCSSPQYSAIKVHMDPSASSNDTLNDAQSNHLVNENENVKLRPFQCLECRRSFGRVEHLTRHLRSHTKERYLKCSYCRKGFYRVDALNRHEKVHIEPKRSGLARGARACLACAASRRKCSGGTLCSACQSRSIECKYPVAGRRGRGTSNINDEEASYYSGGEQTIGSPHYSVMSCSNASNPSNSPRPENIQELRYAPQANQDPNDIGGEQTISLSRGTRNSYSGSLSQHDVQMHAPVSPSQSQLHLAPSHSPMNVSFLTVDDSQSSFASNSRPNLEKSPAGLQSLDARCGSHGAKRLPDPWCQNNFSPINWLQDNWTSDFGMGGRDSLGMFDQNRSSALENMTEASAARYHISSENALNTSSPQDGIGHHIYPPQLGLQALDGQDISSPDSQSTRSAGHYYIDGDGARLPRVRKAPYAVVESSALTAQHESLILRNGFMFPVADEPLGNFNPIPSGIEEIPQSTYNEILRMFSLTCITSTHYSPFQTEGFPSVEVLSQLIRLYIENFQPILPFLHPATFDLSKSHWLFVLALSSIGSHYMEHDDNELFVIAIHEFTRRAIQTVVEASGNSKPDELLLIQAKLLNSVGMMYCGDARLMKSAKAYHSAFVSFCHGEWVCIAPTSRDLSSIQDRVSNDWTMWYEAESRRRTGYCIWLLDCMWSFHFQARPALSLEDASVPIPCQEVLWEAESALVWQQLYESSTPSPSLQSAIQLAYIEKRLQPSMGEFSRILCIHALFQRTWGVERYFRQPLTLWSPTTEKQSISLIERSTPVWLPGNQIYSKWRSSACDVLDILHWHANSVVGVASGMEHPTILHLHLSRIILLTPISQIVQLAQFRAGEATPKTDDEMTATRKHVQRWALEDQYKARLAMIHAGVLIWHVRRYSVDGFYEPSSVFLATLALWAYGTFAAHTLGTHKEGPLQGYEDEEAQSLFPTSMQLDRPADDELVQLFVKQGGDMRAMITGVGNLCSPRGPIRVLAEGRKLLLGLKRWQYSWVAIKTLSALIESCQQEESPFQGL